MIVEKLNAELNIKNFLEKLDVDARGISILATKAKTHFISIKALNVGGANILKQDALSVGADLAVPRGTVLAKTPQVDSLLIATTAQLKKLSRKELGQPFGLKELASKLQAIANVTKPESVEVMGIINANEDSFFSGSCFRDESAIKKIELMIEEGAAIIDIGGVSSAPNTKRVSVEEELSRVKPICDLIQKFKLYEKVAFSIDSYEPEVIEYALKSGFSIVNDITGLENDDLCRVAAKYKAKVVIMHMQGKPENMQNKPEYINILDEISNFLSSRVRKAIEFGIEDIVLDVGIGFGKTLEDNLVLIKHLEHFLALGYPLLIGASRKSMIAHIDNSSVLNRLGGTLAIHLEAVRNGASIVRVHDVSEHVQALKLQKALSL